MSKSSPDPLPVVFLGPSLPLEEAQEILVADYRPPAGQGDLFRAAMEEPPSIALIDGVFKDAPTVRHREILWAMSRGIPVFGASSMGALRAAELYTQGMIGEGLIFRWYRRFSLLPDDAVAVTHSPLEMGARPVSDALVDIRRGIQAARRAGALTADAAETLAREIANRSFPDRHFPQQILPFAVPQKAIDARRLLRRLAAHAARNDWPDASIETPPIVHAWLDDLADSGLRVPEGR